MNSNNILDDIISDLQPEDLPHGYIVMAKVTGMDGVMRIVRGLDLEDFLKDQERRNVAEARVILDVRKIRLAIINAVNSFFDDLARRTLDPDTDTSA